MWHIPNMYFKLWNTVIHFAIQSRDFTFLKSTYAKGKPMSVYYRCFKNFNKELFKKSFSENLKNISNSFEVFYDIFTNTLDCHAPLKKKKIRSNYNIFMTKK